MPFHFPLEAVLHLRKSVEHQQELRLRAANQQVARIRHLIEQIDYGIAQLRAGRAREIDTGTTAAELRFTLQKEIELHQHRVSLERELVRLEALRDQQQLIFRQARQARETFDSVRDRQLREYELDRTRREQREQDDLFLMRQAYRRRTSNGCG